jgi:hypothetical protein
MAAPVLPLFVHGVTVTVSRNLRHLLLHPIHSLIHFRIACYDLVRMTWFT